MGRTGSSERMQALFAHPTLVEDLRAAVNGRLDSLVPAGSRGPQRVNEAVRYALLAPGKRIRPLLTLRHRRRRLRDRDDPYGFARSR